MQRWCWSRKRIRRLAVNARDAMPAGGRLTIETANRHLDAGYAAANEEVREGHYVMIAVTDTGTGMTPEVLKRAFDPFYTTKEVGKGTGLGLSMVYGFARQSGGHAKIYSEPGHGTTVAIYLPRADQADAAPRSDAAIAALPGGSETIVVVEDDPMVSRFVVARLKDLGYRVLDASDGPSAVERMKSGARIDLVLTDVVMPGGMDGGQVADAARTLLPSVKILFTSGYTANAIIHQGKLEAGARLLSKPYTVGDLARAVRAALEG